MPIQRYVINTGFWLCVRLKVKLNRILSVGCFARLRCRAEYAGAMCDTHQFNGIRITYKYPYSRIQRN